MVSLWQIPLPLEQTVAIRVVVYFYRDNGFRLNTVS
jgi:hypothetical protein